MDQPNRSLTGTPCLKLSTSIERDDIEIDVMADIRSSSCIDSRRASLLAMMAQEDMDVYHVCDYLESYNNSVKDKDICEDGKGNHINATCRTSICEWMYRVVDHFGVAREVVAIAASYVDRVLSICLCPDRRTFKLISSASLHLAIKIHSPWQWKKICPLLPELSRGDFDSKRIVAMENEITHWLKWYLNQSTPQCMAMYLLSMLKDVPDLVLQNVVDMALFLIEISICDYEFVTLRNSAIAIAAVLNAIDTLGVDMCDFESDAFSCTNEFRYQIIEVLSSIDYKVMWKEVRSARVRLWSLYRQNTACSRHQDMLLTPTIALKRSMVEGISSPTSVFDAKRLRSRSDFTNRGISVTDRLLEFNVSDDSEDHPQYILSGDARSL